MSLSSRPHTGICLSLLWAPQMTRLMGKKAGWKIPTSMDSLERRLVGKYPQPWNHWKEDWLEIIHNHGLTGKKTGWKLSTAMGSLEGRLVGKYPQPWTPLKEDWLANIHSNGLIGEKIGWKISTVMNLLERRLLENIHSHGLIGRKTGWQIATAMDSLERRLVGKYLQPWTNWKEDWLKNTHNYRKVEPCECRLR